MLAVSGLVQRTRSIWCRLSRKGPEGTPFYGRTQATPTKATVKPQQHESRKKCHGKTRQSLIQAPTAAEAETSPADKAAAVQEAQETAPANEERALTKAETTTYHILLRLESLELVEPLHYLRGKLDLVVLLRVAA